MITLAEQIAEAQRELALRKKCYPAWVKSGKLDAGEAKYQILVQEEIVRTLMRLDAEQRQLSLFGTGRSNMAKTSVTWMRKLLDLTARKCSKPFGRSVWPLWSFSPRYLGKFLAQNKILLFPHWRNVCPGQV